MRTRLTRRTQSRHAGPRQVTPFVDRSTVPCPLRGDADLGTVPAAASRVAP